MIQVIRVLGAAAFAALTASSAHANEWGGKLLLTRGISTVEGAGGGGLASWALITGNATERGIGGTAHATWVDLPDYSFSAQGFAVGFYDRFELSYTRQAFDTEAVGAALGLGQGFTFEQDVLGAKLRLLGDAVYDQDSWVPQLAVGVQYKRNNQDAVLAAIGAEDASGIDIYLAATKIYLDSSFLLNATLRATRANQLGILGFGGDVEDSYELAGEFSAGYLVTRRLLVGAEYRFKPDNLGIAGENDWFDVFAAYAINEHITVTAAYVDLGSIVTFDDQRGLYFSIQAGF